MRTLANEGIGHCCLCEKEYSLLGCLHTGSPTYCPTHLETRRKEMRENFGVHLSALELKLDDLLNTFEDDFDVRVTHVVLYRGKDMEIMSNIITKPINEPITYQKHTGVIIIETDINEGNF